MKNISKRDRFYFEAVAALFRYNQISGDALSQWVQFLFTVFDAVLGMYMIRTWKLHFQMHRFLLVNKNRVYTKLRTVAEPAEISYEIVSRSRDIYVCESQTAS